MMHILIKCLVMAELQCYSIFIFVEANLLMQVEKSVSKNKLSNARQLFLPSMQIITCGARSVSWKKRSSQNGHTTAHLLHSSLPRIFSTLLRVFEIEELLPHA